VHNSLVGAICCACSEFSDSLLAPLRTLRLCGESSHFLKAAPSKDTPIKHQVSYPLMSCRFDPAPDPNQVALGGLHPFASLETRTMNPLLGDFCRETYHLACLLVRHRRCRFAKTNQNSAPVGLFLSGNRLYIVTVTFTGEHLTAGSGPVKRVSTFPSMPGIQLL
jgi:hypothetical protein